MTFRKNVKGPLGSKVEKYFVNCKLKGITEAPLERRKITKRSLCKNYEDDNDAWILVNGKWILKEGD